MEALSLLIFGMLGLLFFFIIRKRWQRMSLLRTLGIPGPKPNLIFGNASEIVKKGFYECLEDWNKEYGQTYGYYLGGYPVIVTIDTEVLKQIEIRDFNSFKNRPRYIQGVLVGNQTFVNHLVNAENDRWKEQRAIMTPSFGSAKVKQMIPHLNKATDIFLGRMEEKSIHGEEFDIYDMFKSLTLDVIARTSFGTETNVQLNPQDPFFEGVKDVDKTEEISPFLLSIYCFPELWTFLSIIFGIFEKLFRGSKTHPLFTAFANMVKERRYDSKFRRDDFLQLLLDAEITREKINMTTNEDLTVNYDQDTESPTEIANVSSSNNKNKKLMYTLSNDEIVSNSCLFMVAGFDTTSASLAYMTYALIKHPEIQEKLREEIQMVEKEDGEIQYSSLLKMKYLDQVMSETLRCYPPIPVLSRAVLKTETYGNIVFPMLASIHVPVKIMHHDPKYWKNPEIFDPERFSPENKKYLVQMAYQPFGGGPRNCIGIRLAQLETKFVMARLLSRYRLVASKNSEIDKLTVVFKPMSTVHAPKKGIFLRLEHL